MARNIIVTIDDDGNFIKVRFPSGTEKQKGDGTTDEKAKKKAREIFQVELGLEVVGRGIAGGECIICGGELICP